MTKPDDFNDSPIIQELRREVELLEEMVRHSRAMLRRADALLAAKRTWLGEPAPDPGTHVMGETVVTLR